MACHYKPYHLHYARKLISHDIVTDKSALLIVDVQKAFLPGGSMEILNEKSDARTQSLMMIENINSLIESGRFDYHVYVQDAHPHDHISFASRKTSTKPFQVVEINHDDQKFQQIMWPDHCRIDGRDAAPSDLSGRSEPKTGSGIEFAYELTVPNTFCNPDAQLDELSAKSFVLNKGKQIDVDSFSAFKDFYGQDTGLHKVLIQKGVKNVYVCGLARDFGVWWTAADASSYFNSKTNAPEFNVNVVWDSTLPAPGTNKLPEYNVEGVIDSLHHSTLRSAIENSTYTMIDVMRGLISNIPESNRWIESFLTPYGVKAVSTSSLLDEQIVEPAVKHHQ